MNTKRDFNIIDLANYPSNRSKYSSLLLDSQQISEKSSTFEELSADIELYLKKSTYTKYIQNVAFHCKKYSIKSTYIQ